MQQLLVALAVVAVIGTPELEGKVVGDIGGLLIATLLGVVYLEYMTFVVAWYGDLPDKAAWFLKRSTAHGPPFWSRASPSVRCSHLRCCCCRAIRSSRAGLRIVGLLLLIGTAMHLAWLIVPAFAAQALCCRNRRLAR